MVKKYKSQIVDLTKQVSGIYTLEFSSLSGPFKYQPGQFLHLAMDEDYDGSGQWPESRCFSMQSNPNEDNIRITYSVKGRFTREMEKTLKPGKELWLKLPYGDLFQRPHNKQNTVFIAGGTGITPFLSLFTHKSFVEYSNPKIYLGFRSREYNIYQSELERSCNSSAFVKSFFDDCDGRIDIKNILTQSDSDSCFFISGPPDMIREFKISLTRNGVQEGNVFTDDWE